MKKLLSILMATVLLITVIGAVPVVSAEEIQYEPVDKEFVEKYWKYWEVDELVKVDGWYYNLTENYYGRKYIRVYGYDGNETEITIPTELGGEEVDAIGYFYLFSDTVKTINIPKGIVFGAGLISWDGYMRFNSTTNLEEIVVEKGHSSYWSQDGVLFQGFNLCLYPPAKKDEEYILPDDIDVIEVGAIAQQKYLKSLTITQEVSLIYEHSIPTTLENLYFYTEENLYSNLREQYWSSENGYSYVEMPRVPNGTIHCIEGSELHSFYQDKASYYKDLEVLKDELVKKENGFWYHIRGGIIDASKSENYVHPYLLKYKDKWFYMRKGVWRKENLLFEYYGKWFYIKNGKWEKDTTDLVWYKGKWFYLKNGKWDQYTDTLFKKNGKWFAIKSGKWYKGKDIIKYKGKKFLVNNGFVQFEFSGKVKVDGTTYKIKNGKVA